MMKGQITISYEGMDSPLNPDGGMSIDLQDRDNAIEPRLFRVVEHDEERQEIVVEVELPDHPCRFLRIEDGNPPACCWESQRHNYMEGCWPGQSPELMCLHCAEYPMCREERLYPDAAEVVSPEGYAELLPELTAEEGLEYRWHYISRETGVVSVAE
ncbi:MAG TPA: hypothetical protein ENJ31_01570 [Anaerolineae bacterium]|nr:hypothetical protein [Anaerolineae bacterium]